MRLILSLSMIALAVSAVPVRAQQATDDHEILVTGQKERDAKSVRRFVRATVLVDDGGVARLADPVCLRVVGLPPAYVDAVNQRVQEVARMAHIRVAKGKCDPNVLAIVSDNADAFANEARRLHPTAFAALSDAERRRALQPGPVHAWNMLDTLNDEGRSIRYNDVDGPVFSKISFATHISLHTQTVIARSVVVIDQNVLKDKSVAQFADYVMMRGVGGAHPGADGIAADTILTLFEPGATPRPTLSAFDISFLKGLYRAPRGQNAVDRVSTILHQITKDSRRAAEEPN